MKKPSSETWIVSVVPCGACAKTEPSEEIKTMVNTAQTRKAAKAKSAFTLIEIMIVVLIIGILLGIAVPNFVRAREASRAKSCIANLKAMDGAAEQYQMDNRLPSNNPPPPASMLSAYLKSIPVCPSNGTYMPITPGPPDPRTGIGSYYCTTSADNAIGDPLAHRLL